MAFGFNPGPCRAPAPLTLLGARDGALWIGSAGGLRRLKDGQLTTVVEGGRFGTLMEDTRGVVWAGRTRIQAPPLCRFARR